MVAWMKPLGDKRLDDSIARACETLDSPYPAPVVVLEGLRQRLLAAFATARERGESEELQRCIDRALLESRAYRVVSLFEGEFIRCLLATDAAPQGIPAYLPKTAATALPLLDSFRCRLAAELHPQQDAAERHPLALRVLALGRALDDAALARPR